MVTGGGDKASSCFDQPARQQQTLTDSIPSVGIFGLVRFFGKVKSLAHSRRQNHLPGLLAEGVHLAVLDALDGIPIVLVDHVEERSPVLDCRRSQRLRQSEVVHLKVLSRLDRESS